jgi:hypothetical protein
VPLVSGFAFTAILFGWASITCHHCTLNSEGARQQNDSIRKRLHMAGLLPK